MPTVIPMDPIVLARIAERQATEDYLPPGETSEADRQRLRDLLDQLDDLDADVVDLVLLRGIDQVRAARILRVSQPTVWYRLRRAVSQLHYLAGLPKVDLRRLRAVLSGFPFDRDVRDFLLEIAEEKSCRPVAERLGWETHRVRRRLAMMCLLPLPEGAVRLYRYILEHEPAHVPVRRDYLEGRGRVIA